MNPTFPMTIQGFRDAMKPGQDYTLIVHPDTTINRAALQGNFPQIVEITDHPLIPANGALLVERQHFARYLPAYRHPQRRAA